MVTEDLINLPGLLTKNIEANDDIEPGEVNVDDTVEKLHRETFSILNTDLCGDLVSDTSDVNMEVDPPEPLRLLDKNNVVGVGLTLENGSLSLARKNDAPEDAACTISLATPSRKRARMEHDADQPSVHVTYKSLRSSSRQKLEELLKQWSNWHAQHCSSSPDASEEVYSGEKTFFPALQVGVEKPSALLFWIDQQTMRTENEGVISFDSKTVPLYDRGYSLGLNTEDYSNNLEGGLEIMDKAARCFNCGSYSHSLKECPKPRDNVTVNNAREQHRSKRNQNAAIRSTTRYYQDTPAGKFNGLKPGTLDSETQKLLGLGELDPPPWLNRMRELGYPPGYLAGCLAHAIVGTKTKAANSVVRAAIRTRCHYVNKKWLGGMLTNWSTTETRLHKFRDLSKEALFICLLTYADVDVDNQPSGIIMFADEEAKADDMDGWIAETRMEPPKKKLVTFPGINAPIPENADEGRWADLPLRSKTSSRQSHDRTSHPSLPINIPYVQDHRLSRYMRDDPPPGTESVFSPLPFHNSVENSSQLSRSLDSYERGRMSHYEDYSSRSYYSFRGYASPGRGGQYSPSYQDSRYGQSVEVGRHYYDRDYPREDWHGSNHRHHRDRDYPSEGGIRYGHHSWR